MHVIRIKIHLLIPGGYIAVEAGLAYMVVR